MLYWRLAYRNLFRQKNRLLLNLILLVGAFSAIVIFNGFKFYVLETMKTVLVETQYGHLQIAKASYWDNSPVDNATDKMLSDPKDLMKRISNIEGVRSVSPRVGFYGLVNTEAKSIPAHFIGLQPELEPKMQDHLSFIDGRPFSESKQAILSSGLQKLLKVNNGDEVTIVSPTLSGSLSAMDLKVSGIFKTGLATVDNATIFLSLKDAQKVLDSDSADQLLITVKNEAEAQEIQKQITALLPGSDLQVKGWKEIADLHNQVENFYNFQNFVVEIVLLLLLLLSITNTTNMTIFERLNEIGTLRALGDYESDIQWLFLCEAVLLGTLALCLSIPVSYGIMRVISSFEIPLTLPMSTKPIPLKMIPYWGAYWEASMICFFSIVIASLWPAKKAAGTSIVTALRAKI